MKNGFLAALLLSPAGFLRLILGVRYVPARLNGALPFFGPWATRTAQQLLVLKYHFFFFFNTWPGHKHLQLHH